MKPEKLEKYKDLERVHDLEIGDKIKVVNIQRPQKDFNGVVNDISKEGISLTGMETYCIMDIPSLSIGDYAYYDIKDNDDIDEVYKNKGDIMQGASLVTLKELEIGDTIKAVHEDGSFEGTIESVDRDGMTLKNIKTQLDYLIAIEDLPEYDFYPRGKTIQDIQTRQAPQAHPTKRSLEEIQKREELFFRLFEALENLGISAQDNQDAILMLDKMQEMAFDSNNPDINDAFEHARIERTKKFTEYLENFEGL